MEERIDLLTHERCNRNVSDQKIQEAPLKEAGGGNEGATVGFGVGGGGGISEWQAAVSLAKAIMGAGSFALPWAFMKMGYIAGPAALVLLMWLSVRSLKQLAGCSRKLATGTATATPKATTLTGECVSNVCARSGIGFVGGAGGGSYVDVARATFGTAGARIAYAASLSASVGVCGSYLVFVAANVRSLFSPLQVRQGPLVFALLPVVIWLSATADDMKKSAAISLLGNVSVFLSMASTVVYGLLYRSVNMGEDCVPVAPVRDMPLALGAMGYLFLVHFVSLPIASSMSKRDRFDAVADRTFAATATASGTFGILGYLFFGPSTQQIVLLNLPADSHLLSLVKMFLCVDLIFTYPVVMRPTIQIIERGCVTGRNGNRAAFLHRRPKVGECEEASSSSVSINTAAADEGPFLVTAVADREIHWIACIAMGLVASIASVTVPAFGLLSALVGGVSQTLLGFVLPPLMVAKQRHLQRQGQQREKEAGADRLSLLLPPWWFLVRPQDALLVATGLVMIVWTLLTTWHELLRQD